MGLYRPAYSEERGTVCVNCGSVVIDTKAHDKVHEFKGTRAFERMTVGELTTILNAFPSEMTIAIEGFGYEIDSVRLKAEFKGAPDLTILEW